MNFRVDSIVVREKGDLTVLSRKNGNMIVEDEFGKIYTLSENNQAVVMLARQSDSFIFVQQFRRAVNDFVIQLPGGMVESGEDLEAAVRREFLEEVGGQCGAIQYLGSLTPASWISNVMTHVFYTDEIIEIADQQLEEYEHIKVLEISVEETLNMIKDSKINDSEVAYAILQGILKGLIKV
ncbi:NUDIX hydrolase [Paenibacillus humicus]|uniref:NUDIX hydrolase n=1 Tax=Paenibacillus humicus TaxID=412861 RepID=UPI003D269B07